MVGDLGLHHPLVDQSEKALFLLHLNIYLLWEPITEGRVHTTWYLCGGNRFTIVSTLIL